MGKLDEIKAAQLASGEHPYAGAPAAISVAELQNDSKLGDYQLALQVDKAKISGVNDIAEKQRIKASVLPTYLGFVDAYLGSGDNYSNSVAVQVMVWLFDTDNIDKALPLAFRLIEQRQNMPNKFDRDMPTFVCDTVYDWASLQLDKGVTASPHLDACAEQALAWDVHVVCKSKLLVMLAKHKEIQGDIEAALAFAQQAESINPSKAGTKGLIDRLRKALKAPPAKTNDDSAAQPNG